MCMCVCVGVCHSLQPCVLSLIFRFALLRQGLCLLDAACTRLTSSPVSKDSLASVSSPASASLCCRNSGIMDLLDHLRLDVSSGDSDQVSSWHDKDFTHRAISTFLVWVSKTRSGAGLGGNRRELFWNLHWEGVWWLSYLAAHRDTEGRLKKHLVQCDFEVGRGRKQDGR